MDDSLPFQLDPALLAGFAADQGYHLPTAAAGAGAAVIDAGGSTESLRNIPKRARWKLPALVAGCLVFGSVGGVVGQFLTAPPPAAADDAHKATDAKHDEAPHVDHHEQIEDWIRAGRYADALKLIPGAPPAHDHAAWYQRGLANEGLKKFADARAAYERATDSEGDPIHWAVALLGQVRCHLAANDWDRARALLSKVELRAGTHGFSEAHIPSECAFLRGRLDLQKLGIFPEPDPLSAESVAWPTFLANAEAYLDWLIVKRTPDAHAGHTAAEHPPEKHGAAPDPHGSPHLDVRTSTTMEREVSATLPSTPLLALLKELATAAGLTFQYTPEQESKLRGRSSPLEVEGLAFPVVMTALVEPLGFGWETTAEHLRLIPVAPEPKPVLRDRARRAFTQSVVLAPEHPFARRALLAAANLDFQEQKYSQAAAGYRRLQESNRLGDDILGAVYNLGLTQLKLKNPIAAREIFLDLVDRSVGGRWTDLGWYWMGRADLDAGDIRSAFRPLRNALAGKSKDARSAAAIGLVTCHLLQGDSEEALEIHRKLKIAPLESHAPYSKLFDELFRYRTTPTDLRATNLNEAIAACGEAKTLGPAGLFLVGDLYRELGKGRKMTALYEREIDHVKGAWALRMTFAIGVHLEGIGDAKAARQRYLAVSVVDPNGVGLKAELRLAAMAAGDGRGGECLARCKRLVGKPGLDSSELLPVMGRGYELEMNHRFAAECFAGRFPMD